MIHICQRSQALEWAIADWQENRVLRSLMWSEPHLKTARTVRGADWNMVFWEERALAATVPRSPSLSYSAFTFCMDLPVAWASACKHKGLLLVRRCITASWT